jgi:hypothetical protein
VCNQAAVCHQCECVLPCFATTVDLFQPSQTANQPTVNHAPGAANIASRKAGGQPFVLGSGVELRKDTSGNKRPYDAAAEAWLTAEESEERSMAARLKGGANASE